MFLAMLGVANVVAPATAEPPVLDSIAFTNNGDGTGSFTLSFSENEVSGTSVAVRLFIDTAGDADPDAATAWAGTGADGTSAITTTVGATSVSATLTGTLEGDYEVFAVASYDSGTTLSNVVKATGTVEFDNVAPSLSSPTGTQTGATTASISVTSNDATGTVYGGVWPAASTPSAADIKAGTGATFHTSAAAADPAGSNAFSATGLTASTDYKAQFVHEDASGNLSSASASAEFTTAAGSALPQVTGYSEAWSGNASSLNVTAPTTTASDTILLCVTHRSGSVTITPPANFSAVYNSGNAVAVFAWDGTGTRPNANTQTVTFSASESCGAQMIALDSGTATHIGTLADATGSTATMPAVSTTSANALVLNLWRYRTAGFGSSYSGSTPDETAFSNPDTEFQEQIQPQSDHAQLIQTIEQASAGAINRMTLTSLVYYSGVVVEIA